MFILIATDWTAQLPSSMYWSMTFMSWSGSQQESENSKCQHSACNTPSAYAVQRPGQILSPYPHPSMHCSAPGEANVMVAHVAQRACADVQDAETRVCAERKPGDYREEEIKRLFFLPDLSFLQPCGWPLSWTPTCRGESPWAAACCQSTRTEHWIIQLFFELLHLLFL